MIFVFFLSKNCNQPVFQSISLQAVLIENSAKFLTSLNLSRWQKSLNAPALVWQFY